MDKIALVEYVRNYIDTEGSNAAEFARNVGVSVRNMQRYVKGETEISDRDVTAICKYFGIPSETPLEKRKNDNTDAISIKGSAKQNAIELKRFKGYKYDYMAASVLVRIGWETVVKQGINNFDFEPYE